MNIAVILEGGLVQTVVSDQPALDILVAVIDYDTADGCDEEELTGIIQADGSVVKAFVSYHNVNKQTIDFTLIFSEE